MLFSSDLFLRFVFDDMLPVAPGAARMDGEVVEHSIETGGAYPIARPPRRQSPAMEAVIEKEVKNLLDAKIIRPSNSPWASNLVLVKKKDGTWRPRVDFRELNAESY